MAPKIALLALGIAAATPLAAASASRMEPAPAGTPDTRYCMRVEAPTGSRVERVLCMTRAEWTDQGVDVDHDWTAEGVRTIG